MKVRITQGMIDDGVPIDPQKCPLSIGIRDAAAEELADGHPVLVAAFVSFAWIWIGDRRMQVSMPREAAAFVCAFDNGRPVQPFEFDLTF